MPPLTTVADAELAIATKAAQRAGAALAAEQTELHAAEAAEAQARRQREALAAVDADLRRHLAAASAAMAADATGLADDVERNTVALRAAGIAVAQAERAAADARRHFATAGERSRATQEQLAAAAAAKAGADADAAQLAAAETALGKAPLKTVAADAGTALGGQALADADARLAADIPAELLARARARLTIEHAELGDAIGAAHAGRAATLTAATAQGGRPSVTGAGESAVAGARGAYLATLAGREELTRALTAIAAVKALPALTDDRRARTATGAVHDAGKAAAAAEKTRDDAREAVRGKRAAHSAKVLAAVVAHPEADPDGDGDVQTAKGALDTAVAALVAAELALNTPAAAGEPTPRQAFGRWEATVPDELWNALVGLELARAALTRLNTTDPAALRTAVTAAEDALGTAVAAEADGSRAVVALLALATETAGAAATAADCTSDLTTARGDA